MSTFPSWKCQSSVDRGLVLRLHICKILKYIEQIMAEVEEVGFGGSDALTGVKLADGKSRWSVVRSWLSRIVKVEKDLNLFNFTIK
jgi:hypothetical protein